MQRTRTIATKPSSNGLESSCDQPGHTHSASRQYTVCVSPDFQLGQSRWRCQSYFRFFPDSRCLSEWSASPKSADSVEKVFFGRRAKFSRTADVSRKRWREGPHRFKQKRPRTIVSALRGFDAVETSKNQLSLNFRSRSIFGFCNSIGTFRTRHVCDQVLSGHRRG